MSEEILKGYRGKAKSILQSSRVTIGDIIRITDGEIVYEGTLMPRVESSDDLHTIIKLKNGYNIGIRMSSNFIVEKIGEGEKPRLTRSFSTYKRTELPKITIISTGGTIASRVEYRTGSVHPALSADDLLDVVPELSNIADIETEILYSLFSENVRSIHWTEMAKTCEKHIRKGARGIVLCHGTDTLGYTASALSFALQNLPIPIILVGAQRSSDRPSSDATLNLIGATKAATNLNVAEVLVAMHESTSDDTIVFHRGTKVRKCHTSRRDAFRSVNSRPVAKIKDDNIEYISEDYVTRDQKREVTLKPNFEENVALLKFYPDLKPELIDWLSEKRYKGIIFEGTGLGHVNSNLLSSVENAIEKGIMLAMTSQCIWGRVNMNVYDTGRDLQSAGIIPLEDMLPETALVKMMWILGQTTDLNEARELMLRNMVSELNPRTVFGENETS